MSLFEAVLLGIIQGITEFVPVSSSGHLLLVPNLLNLTTPDLNLVAVSHMGTLLALIVYFRRDLWRIVAAVLDGLRRQQPVQSNDARLGWYIAIGSIPVVVVALAFRHFFDEIFEHPLPAAFFLLGTAALLVLGERMLAGHKRPEQMTWLDAVVVGCFQALALLPGISRSGSTMVGGLLRGLDRPTAARYSFLLSVPVTAGAGLLETVNFLRADSMALQIGPVVVTFMVSAVVGLLCIHFLLAWLRQRSLYSFAVYCVAFSLFYLATAALR